MSKRFVKVAVCQRSNEGTPEENLERSMEMITRAVEGMPAVDVVLLPECNMGIPETAEGCTEIALNHTPRYWKEMSALASQLHINLIPGSVQSMSDDGRTQNTTVFINREGEILGRYSKIHLFDAFSYKESDHVAPGDKIVVLDTDIGRVGLQICYDLRFPELSRAQALAGAQIIFHMAFFPGGNPLPPRTDQWDGFVDSMAFLNQTWVCSCNVFGSCFGEHPFGRSRIVDPWGTPVAIAGNHEDIIYSTLDLEYNDICKNSTGGFSNRRPDIYEKFYRENGLH